MKKIILIFLSIFLSNVLFSQTILSPGDIAIIQYNSDNSPEEIKFLVLKNFEVDTVIYFTDNGWKSDNTFRATEGIVKWTASRDYICGEIVTMNMQTIGGEISEEDAGFDLSASGDQILAYQNLSSPHNFIFAVNNETNSSWQTDSTSSNTSAIPTGLTNGVNAVALKETDNLKYDESLLSGSKLTVLTNICATGNWSGANNSNQTFSGTFNTTWNEGSWTGGNGNYLITNIDADYNTSSGDFSTCNCTVNAGNTLTVNSGGTVTVEENITNNGTILVESGGSVVQISPNAVNTGTDYTVERTTTSQSSRHVFTYWSSPITTATFSAVATDAHLYYSFNASAQDWVLGSASTGMSAGIGYALEGPDADATYPGAQTASFIGAPFNNGDISVSLSFNDDGDADNDWNLIGNPYPSAISADTFLADNSSVLGGTIYFWTHNTDEDGIEDNTQDDYAMYTYGTGGIIAGTGGIQPDGNIASGQGFFVQALSNGVVSDLFTNSMRITGSNTSFFKTERKTNEEKDRIWLNLTNDKSFSQILIGFFDNATNDEDRKYDGLRFISKPSLNFYSMINDKEFGIQGLSEIKDENYISLGFSTDKTGDFKIAIDKREGELVNSKIFIWDKLLDIKFQINESDYEFSLSESGTYNDRFVLIVESNGQALSLNDEGVSSGIVIENFNNNLVIKTSDKTLIKKVSIYNILGKEIITKKVSSVKVRLTSKGLKTNSILIVKTFLETGEVIINKIYKN